jgi:heme-degrading monooxygenase HmoA
MQLVASARSFFADSSEWRLTLSKDFTLEPTPVSAGPVIDTYSVSTTTSGGLPPPHERPQTFMRIVSLHHKAGKLEEYKELYQREIIPTLIATRGCQYACLSTPADGSSESISVTLWNSRADAEAYERQGTFRKLLQKVRHTLSDLSQLHLESVGTGLPSTTSEDIAVEGFQFIAGMSVQQ